MHLATEPIGNQVAASGGINALSSLFPEKISMVFLRFGWGSKLNSMRNQVKAHLDLLPLPGGDARPIVHKFDLALPVAVSSDAEMGPSQLLFGTAP